MFRIALYRVFQKIIGSDRIVKDCLKDHNYLIHCSWVLPKFEHLVFDGPSVTYVNVLKLNRFNDRVDIVFQISVQVYLRLAGVDERGATDGLSLLPESKDSARQVAEFLKAL